MPVAAIAGRLTGKYVLLLPVARHFIAFAGRLTGKRLSEPRMLELSVLTHLKLRPEGPAQPIAPGATLGVAQPQMDTNVKGSNNGTTECHDAVCAVRYMPLSPFAAVAGCLTGKYVLLLPVAAIAGRLTGKHLGMCHECTNYR